jgi:hypothetical protein
VGEERSPGALTAPRFCLGASPGLGNGSLRRAQPGRPGFPERPPGCSPARSWKLALQQQAVKIEEQARSARKLRQRLVFASLALVAAIVFGNFALYTGNLRASSAPATPTWLSCSSGRGAGACQRRHSRPYAAAADAARATALSDRAAAIEAQFAAR